MLARGMASAPDLMLVDEPTAQLDRATSAEVNRAIGALAESGTVVVVATHGAVIRSVVNAAAPGTADRGHTPIRNGSIHSFRWDPERFHAELVRFDDPIDDVSDATGGSTFEYQNPLERRG